MRRRREPSESASAGLEDRDPSPDNGTGRSGGDAAVLKAPETSGEHDNEPQSEDEKLALLLADARAQLAAGHSRQAVDTLLEHRRLALRSAPHQVLDALPLARKISHYYSESDTDADAVRAEALQYIDSAPGLLAFAPSVAQEFERRVLQYEIDKLTARVDAAGTHTWMIAGFFVLVAVGGGTLLILSSTETYAWAKLPGLIALAAGVALAPLSFGYIRARKSFNEARIQNLQRKRRVLEAVGSSAGATTEGQGGTDSTGSQYFTSLVRINVDNLSDYYTLVRVHTNNSFWASLGAGLLGFSLIGVGLGFGFGSHDSATISYISTGSGVIVEFISGVFFYLYNRTVRQLKDYHDSLLDVQNILLSFKIVEDADATDRAILFGKILSYLLRRHDEIQASPSANT